KLFVSRSVFTGRRIWIYHRSFSSTVYVYAITGVSFVFYVGLSTSNGNDCSSKPETGPCRGYFPKFYFDPRDKDCKRFIYGGCRGNGNRYATKEDCLEACGNDCSSKPETGPCRGYFPSFYFDPSDKTCKRFIYGGCRGNGTDMPLKRTVWKPVEMIVPPSQKLDRVVDISPTFTLTPVIKLVNVLSMEDAAEMETDMPLKRTVRKPVGVSNSMRIIQTNCAEKRI
ncbi:BPTI/Kunitz domain-containing protein, partial [Acropora cervicornis]